MLMRWSYTQLIFNKNRITAVSTIAGNWIAHPTATSRSCAFIFTSKHFDVQRKYWQEAQLSQRAHATLHVAGNEILSMFVFFYLWPCLIDSRLALSSWNFQNRPPIAQKSCHSIRQVAASCSGERDESRVQQLTGLIGLSIRPAYVRPYSCWTAFIAIQ